MVEHDDLLTQWANHFNPNANMLLVKAEYKQEDVAKLVQELSEPIDITAKKKIYKSSWGVTEKIDFAKVARPRLRLPLLKLKIHKEALRHITAEKVNEEEKIQLNTLDLPFLTDWVHSHLKLRSMKKKKT